MDGYNKPQLSVIVPIFNAEKYLEKCIESIVNQTFQNMEIILVDDGSTDHSLNICRKYQDKDKRIKVITKSNGGLIRARKTGLSAASADFIGFVDSDDWIEPLMYEELVKYMVESECDLVSSGIVRDYAKVGQKSLTVLDHYKEGIYQNLNSTIYPTMLFSEQYQDFGIYCTLVNKLYKKELLEQVYENINENVFYGEDALTCYPYCLLANRIYILHKAFYHYNIRPGTMASSSDERLPYNNYLLYCGLREAFLKSDCSLILMRQLKKYLMQLERHSLLVLYQLDVVAFDEWYFSFPEKIFDQQFVLYGAGVCGQALYRKINRMGKVRNMALWVDQDAENRTEECAYPIYKPDDLLHTDWDIIIVSVQSEKLADEIINDLMKRYCIKREKIAWSNIEHIPIWDIY